MMTSERKRRPVRSGNNGDASAHVPQDEPLVFEEALSRLDEAVQALESGRLPLDDALRIYEEGVHLAQRCQRMLDNAELRVERLHALTQGDGAALSSATFVLETLELGEDE